MKIENSKIIFSTGKVRSANGGIIGLGKDFEVTGGYDAGFYSGQFSEESRDEDERISNNELIELAEYMIEQWKMFRSSLGK